MQYQTEVEDKQTLSSVPMLSADGVAIKINMILYEISWSSGYDFRKEGKFTLDAHRVFHVNNSGRVYRTRCARGCEEVHKMSDGCKRSEQYAKIENAKNALRKKIQADMKKCKARVLDVNKTFAHIQEQDRIVSYLSKSKIKEPKQVKL